MIKFLEHTHGILCVVHSSYMHSRSSYITITYMVLTEHAHRTCMYVLIHTLYTTWNNITYIMPSLSYYTKVRWKVAWDSLIDQGWVTSHPELGFTIPAESCIIGSIPVQITERRQWVSTCTCYFYYFVFFHLFDLDSPFAIFIPHPSFTSTLCFPVFVFLLQFKSQ